MSSDQRTTKKNICWSEPMTSQIPCSLALTMEIYDCMIWAFPVPKFAISQSEAKSSVLISYDIKSLT